MEQFNEMVNSLLGNPMPQPDTAAILMSLLTALAFSAIIWLVYRLSNTPATYQPRFAATLVSLAILSTILMDLIQSNLALSLGMLGSLSIVRFRTNIKDPRDIGYIFWAMAAGLASSTGCYLIGIAGQHHPCDLSAVHPKDQQRPQRHDAGHPWEPDRYRLYPRNRIHRL